MVVCLHVFFFCFVLFCFADVCKGGDNLFDNYATLVVVLEYAVMWCFWFFSEELLVASKYKAGDEQNNAAAHTHRDYILYKITVRKGKCYPITLTHIHTGSHLSKRMHATFFFFFPLRAVAHATLTKLNLHQNAQCDERDMRNASNAQCDKRAM
jgi:hypothetical protein